MTEQNISTQKRCDMCKNFVAIELFGRNKSKKDGLASTCKICTKEYNQRYYEKNKEREQAARRADYQAKKDQYKARARKWESENRDRKRELNAAYRLLNGAKIQEFGKRDWLRHGDKRRAAKKAYRQANPERGAEHVRARQTRKQRAMPMWADRDAIRAIYAECRRISQETGIKHHVDHYYPLKNPLVCGLHNQYNLQIIPAAENQSKGNSLPTEES
jgi:hypothetical protein